MASMSGIQVIEVGPEAESQLVCTQRAVEFAEVFRGDDVFECPSGGIEPGGDVEVDFFLFEFVAVEEGVEGLDVALPE